MHFFAQTGDFPLRLEFLLPVGIWEELQWLQLRFHNSGLDFMQHFPHCQRALFSFRVFHITGKRGASNTATHWLYNTICIAIGIKKGLRRVKRHQLQLDSSVKTHSLLFPVITTIHFLPSYLPLHLPFLKALSVIPGRRLGRILPLCKLISSSHPSFFI